MLRRFVIVVAVLMATLAVTGTASAQGKELKFGTQAPKDSAWGKVFNAWAKAVSEESSGALTLTWYFGTKGDEAAMVGKMTSKEIDGAAMTATGLAQIWPHISALQLPGLFPQADATQAWAKLDAVRDKMQPKIEAGFAGVKVPFAILGKGDVGIARLMSRGFAVRTPEDLKKHHPFYITGDPIGQKFLETVGVASPRSLSIPAILPAISARGEGAVDIINSPPIAAEQLGWAPHTDTIVTNMGSGIGIGALVILKETLDALPADAKAVLSRTGLNTGKLLTERIRGIDAAAFGRFKASKTAVDLTDTEKAAWAGVFSRVRGALKAENKVRADIFDEVVREAGVN